MAQRSLIRFEHDYPMQHIEYAFVYRKGYGHRYAVVFQDSDGNNSSLLLLLKAPCCQSNSPIQHLSV